MVEPTGRGLRAWQRFHVRITALYALPLFAVLTVVAVLAYRAEAERPDAPILKALCASSYVRDEGTWRLMSHQQTPA